MQTKLRLSIFQIIKILKINLISDARIKNVKNEVEKDLRDDKLKKNVLLIIIIMY